jgi:hypothetical protein
MAKKIDKAPAQHSSTEEPSSWPGLIFRIISNVKILLIALLILILAYTGFRFAGYDVLRPVLAKLGNTEIQPAVSFGDQGNQVEFIDNADLSSIINGAKSQIRVVGFVVDKLETGELARMLRENKNLRVEFVMVDPNGTAVSQRERDENVSKDRMKTKLQGRIDSLKDNCKEFLGDRLKVGIIDAYPTIEVFIIDDDLYAYSFPYHAYGSVMPVLRFKNYVKNKFAEYYKAHLESIFQTVRNNKTFVR